MLAPDIFDQDDEGIVVLLDDRPGEDQEHALQEAVSMCPTGVIWVDRSA
ncbi:ferredoxin [Antribacter gilvus]